MDIPTTTEFFHNTVNYNNINATMKFTPTTTPLSILDPENDADQEFIEYIRNWIATEFCKNPSLLRFAFRGIGILVFSLFGILGNILSMFVLTRPAIRVSSTSIILLGLAISDLVFVTTNIFINGILQVAVYFCWWPEFYTQIYPVGFPIVYPLSVTAQMCSIYFTLLVTMERFIAVYHPIMARLYCSTNNAKRAAITVVVVSVLYSLPTWWQLTYEYNYVNGIYTHSSNVPGMLGQYEKFMLYYVFWGNVIIIILLPFITIVVLNTAIFIRVRQSNRMRKNMTHSELNEVSLTRMLLTIVLIFLVCYAIGFYQRISQIVGGRSASPQDFVDVGIFLLNVNSSINFIVYCLMGKKFRKAFIGLFEFISGNTSGGGRSNRKDTEEIQLSG